MKKFDVFISHASEDKDNIARELASILIQLGLNVWYDEYTLEIGDSIRRRIDDGLKKSKYGVLILSKHFFKKHWTQKELDGLMALNKKILPVWHNIDHKDVANFSPMLADLIAISSSEGVITVATKIAEFVTNNPYVSDEKVHELEVEFPYIRKLYKVERELFINKATAQLDIHSTMEMIVEGVTGDCNVVSHSVGVGKNKNIIVEPIEATFVRKNGRMSFIITKHTDTACNWRVVFDPPLEQGELASYKIKWEYQNSLFLSNEQFTIDKLMRKSGKKFCSLARSMPAPCEKFITSVRFPKGYEIFQPNVEVVKSGLRFSNETKRISSSNFFKASPPDDEKGWHLQLEIPNPIISLSYYLQWLPPYLSNLLENKLITKEQKKIINIDLKSNF